MTVTQQQLGIRPYFRMVVDPNSVPPRIDAPREAIDRQLPLTINELDSVMAQITTLLTVLDVRPQAGTLHDFVDTDTFLNGTFYRAINSRLVRVSLASPLELVIWPTTVGAVSGLMWLWREITERRFEQSQLRVQQYGARVAEAQAEVAQALSRLVVQQLTELEGEANIKKQILAALDDSIQGASQVVLAVKQMDIVEP